MYRASRGFRNELKQLQKQTYFCEESLSFWSCSEYYQFRLNKRDSGITIEASSTVGYQSILKRYQHNKKDMGMDPFIDKDLKKGVNKGSIYDMNMPSQSTPGSIKSNNPKPHPDFGKRVWKATEVSKPSSQNTTNNSNVMMDTKISEPNKNKLNANYLENDANIPPSQQSLSKSESRLEYTANQDGEMNGSIDESPFIDEKEIDLDRSLPGRKKGSTTTSIWAEVDHTEALKEVEPSQIISTMGVLSSNKEKDLMILVNNYTAPVLATGLRDREETLQLCAKLIHEENNIALLKEVLLPYQANMIERRRRNVKDLDLSYGIHRNHLNMLRKYLHRLPRQITRAVPKRASVVIPLCNVNGVSSVLFQKRSSHVRSHTNQVCFPGGMVEESQDANIIDTSLREMKEEIGFPVHQVEILGVLRCDWSEVAKITGVGVTPVVGFLGELTEYELDPNASEVAELFTIPIDTLVKEEYWGFAPPSNSSSQTTTDDKSSLNSVNLSAKSALHDENPHETGIYFSGGPHIIWGLTAYILNRFLKDILLKYRVKTSVHND